MEAAAANHRYDQLHEALQFHDGTFTQWAKAAGPETPYHYRDGVTIWVSTVDLDPEGTFLQGSDDSDDDQGEAVSDGGNEA